MAIRTAVNRALTAITALPTAAALTDGNLTLLTTVNVSSSTSTVSFTSSIDSTYNSYLFKFIDIHPASEYGHLQFQADTGTNTNYNQTITSSSWTATNNEGDTEAIINYQTGSDQAQGTAFQHLMESPQLGTNNDENLNGYLHIFNPSSTTFIKHFIIRNTHMATNPGSRQDYSAGYCNVTAAIDGVDFKFSSGNIDSGVIKMYGLSKS